MTDQGKFEYFAFISYRDFPGDRSIYSGEQLTLDGRRVYFFTGNFTITAHFYQLPL